VLQSYASTNKVTFHLRVKYNLIVVCTCNLFSFWLLSMYVQNLRTFRLTILRTNKNVYWQRGMFIIIVFDRYMHTRKCRLFSSGIPIYSKNNNRYFTHSQFDSKNTCFSIGVISHTTGKLVPILKTTTARTNNVSKLFL